MQTEPPLQASAHDEAHFLGGQVVRDAAIGMADGLTVPFALAAGLTGAIASSSLVVTAGLAEVAAGSIAMGLGGYLAGKAQREHYHRERRREEHEIVHLTEVERQEVRDIFAQYGISLDECAPVLAALERRPAAWVDFMMRFELGLELPTQRQALQSALTIACAYVVGGLIPLSPYFLYESARDALWSSALLTLIALFGFGYLKGRLTSGQPWASAWTTVLVGAAAAGAAYGIAAWIS
jgi:vacuolar iron transporter family protein